MRRFIHSVYILFLMFTLIPAQQYWEWQKPLPQGNTLTYIKSFSGDSLLAYGRFDGVIMKSINGGQDWDIHYQVNGSRYVDEVFFYNFNTGWAVGDSGYIHKTTDGGLTWTTYEVNDPTLYSRYTAVFFINASTGWIAGNSDNISKTTDGGITWTHYPFSPTASIYSIYFLNDTLGWAAGTSGRIYHTTDGGLNWTYQPQSGFSTLNDIYFANPDTGWAAGSLGTIIRTVNGGNSWEEAQGLTSYYSLNDIYFWDGVHGLAVGDVGQLLKSADAGETWSSIDTVTNVDYKSVSYFDAQNIFVVGINGIMLHSADEGSSWTEMSDLTNLSSLECIKFIDENTGWAAGESILKTTDSGENWIEMLNVNGNIMSFDILDAQNLFFLHAQTGDIYRTIDGGINWDTLSPGIGILPFIKCDFIDAITGWILDAQDYVLKTTDGGASWNIYPTNDATSFFAQDMFFIDHNNGWVVGTEGTIQKTTDGGETWNIQNSSTTNIINTVMFIDANTGWAAGENVLLKTTNGGINWNLLNDNYTYAELWVVDSNTLWALGKAAGIHTALSSSDGGVTWQEEILPSKNMRGMHFTDSENGWICGLYGGVLKRTVAVSSITHQIEENIPPDFVLQQNYPNPFNPKTIIRYSLPVNSFLDLSVYNILGQKVATLVSAKQPAGKYEVQWDAGGFASGVYLYKLSVNSRYVYTKKLVLLK
ncbi:MAG: T9SS type A sorting domain-containing protein [Calditrichaceae bacterium]|nr:T9SS type A sorting domain-containing protein [Calditrichaceae bacterium]MBN2709463.1 T9SS type A sorting domain-containing protein [Calditrichaceae bacterium]RQV94059.1 MAG: T9SS C-terminal target domain-containing protein [Calditrichota bacterium]